MSFHVLLWFLFSVVTSVLPVTVPSPYQVRVEPLNGSSASAIQGGADVRIYWQASDGSLHEWRSYAPNSVTYLDTFLVRGDDVRANTPIAAVGDSATSIGEHSVYYISPDSYLRGYCMESIESHWYDCALNDNKFAVKTGSKYLYAVALPGGFVRVGYQCVSGRICEASSRRDGEWQTREV